MLSEVVDVLLCPVCDRGLALAEGSLRCDTGHSFDVARQGYVNLLPGGGSTGTADTADMVRCRSEFLGAGHYAPLTSALASHARDGLVLDAGAGTGHYLAAVLDRAGGATGLALDLSKYAARRAAKAHPRAMAAVADSWARLPVADQAVSLVLNVFAPRNGPEFARVLRPDGVLLVVTPTGRHLAELVSQLDLLSVDAAKQDRLDAALGRWFEPLGKQEVEFGLTLSEADVRNLVLMGPSAHHLSPDDLTERLAELGFPYSATVSCTLSSYRPA
ncbi:class I SAM-dependent methyltransferase [Flindersiella endophytica]